jgi:hypothetical protein
VDFRAAVNESQIHHDWTLWTYINSLGSRGAVQNSLKLSTSAYGIPMLNLTITTAGGRITCLQCNATSKRTKQQCRAPAARNMTKCRFHGGASTGPKSYEGRQRCAEAKAIHGRETRKTREVRALAVKRLRDLEDIGRSIGLIRGAKTVGRKPK